ncbi:MAG: hybrid sensor histidine kinase/response regulator [Anaerolineales bacterium]|nr:hybrid sensor histidine kinase/response regulator [Anaerolineales bacterium]
MYGGTRTEIGQEWDGLSRDGVVQQVHADLAHLYDAEHLRASPLARLLRLAGRFDTASALRDVLMKAIAVLKPADDVPAHLPPWLLYQSLYCCYVQQLGQQLVADQLGISVRQLRREQVTALEHLVDHLWQTYHDAREQKSGVAASAGEPEPTASQQPSGLLGEMAWLKDLPTERPTDLLEILNETLTLIQPLAADRAIKFQPLAVGVFPPLAVHPVALTQMLVDVLTAALGWTAPGGLVAVTARVAGYQVILTVVGGGGDAELLAQGSQDELHIARQIAEVCGAALTLPSREVGEFRVTLSLPAREQVPVLVVDDNEDALQLLQRYAVGTRYRVVGTQDPEQALALAERLRPQVIVLDVMMPQVDGWRLLGRLRQHPLTADTPVVVCTIVTQEELAFSLGASGFIRKPVTRAAFLAALDAQAAPRATAAH